MRRKRCPYCKSLNTIELICGNKKDGITMTGYVCDNCDMTFDCRECQDDGTWKKIPNEAVS